MQINIQSRVFLFERMILISLKVFLHSKTKWLSSYAVIVLVIQVVVTVFVVVIVIALNTGGSKQQ